MDETMAGLQVIQPPPPPFVRIDAVFHMVL